MFHVFYCFRLRKNQKSKRIIFSGTDPCHVRLPSFFLFLFFLLFLLVFIIVSFVVNNRITDNGLEITQLRPAIPRHGTTSDLILQSPHLSIRSETLCQSVLLYSALANGKDSPPDRKWLYRRFSISNTGRIFETQK